MRRVVVTGLGVQTPLRASSAAEAFDSLLARASGIREFDSGVAKIDKAGVANPDGDFISLALSASKEAYEDAGFHHHDVDPDRVGIAVGSGMGSLASIVDATALIESKGPRKLSPFFVPRTLINLAAGRISMKLNCRGPNHSVSTACATGAHAIGDAFNFIQLNHADVMLAGSTESALSTLDVAGFASMKALSTRAVEDVSHASCPFSTARDGFVVGQGAGVVVLEELSSALGRNARIYAELVGYGLTGDAFHVTKPRPDGSGARRAIKAALSRAGIDKVDYVNAHATSTPLGDSIEADVATQALSEKGRVSSNKGNIGHLLGAAGSVEAVFTILALHKQKTPPTLNLTPDVADVDEIDRFVWEDDSHEMFSALTNSFGFGGTNASLVFKRFVK